MTVNWIRVRLLNTRAAALPYNYQLLVQAVVGSHIIAPQKLDLGN